MTIYYVDGVSGNDGNSGSSGSPWATIAHGLATMANTDILGIRATGVYSIGTGLIVSVGLYNSVTRMVGCTTTVGDGGMATIKATSSIVGLTINSTGLFSVENLIFDGNSGTGSQGVSFTSTNGGYMNKLINCIVKNWANEGVISSCQGASVIGVEVFGCSGVAAVSITTSTMGSVIGCKIHDNTAPGLYFTDNGVVSHNLVYNNTGASSDGIILDNFACAAFNNTSHGNGRHGISITQYNIRGGILNNICTSNGGYGLNVPTLSPGAVDPAMNYNAFYNNTSGSYNIIQAGPNDIALLGLPYNNAIGNDFTLNNITGQGAACRGVGFPAYIDIGALQHQDSGNAPSLQSYIIRLNMNGGLFQ